MARLPYGAVALIDEVQRCRSGVTAKPVGDPDGFDVFRTIKFDKRTSDWLAPLLDQIKDPRIVERQVTDAGYLHVTFSPRPIADFRDKWPLEAAQQVVERGL